MTFVYQIKKENLQSIVSWNIREYKLFFDAILAKGKFDSLVIKNKIRNDKSKRRCYSEWKKN